MYFQVKQNKISRKHVGTVGGYFIKANNHKLLLSSILHNVSE